MPMHIMGDVWNLRELKRSLKDLAKDHGRLCAITVAEAVAPVLTELMQGAFDAGQTIFDEPRPEAVDGRALTLVQTGATRSNLRWVQTGTIVRAALGTPYARFLIGHFKIMPSGAQELPFRWQDVLLDTANETIDKFLNARAPS